MTRRFAPALLVTLLLTAAAVPAQASQVAVTTVADCGGDIVCDKFSGGQPKNILDFAGVGAEANDVRMTLEPDGAHIAVTDAGAALTPGNKCVARDDHTVVCDVSGNPLTTFKIVLGDGDDRFTFADAINTPLNVDAGNGDDEVHAGVGRDTVNGGAGRDKLFGGAGDDLFPAGDAAEPDVFDGGAGLNTVDYRARKEALRINLGDAGATQGEVGEGDTLARIQNVYAGEGADSLGGDDSANALRGGGGDDVIAAGAGNDSLIGDSGRDQLDAGAGNDYIDSYDSGADTISCGAGKDEVGSIDYTGEYLDEPQWYSPDAKDRLAADCERVWLAGGQERVILVPAQVSLHGKVATISNPCRTARVRRECKGTLRIGSYSKRRFNKRGARVSLALDRRDRAVARKGPIRVSIQLNFGAGAVFLATPSA